MAKVINGMLIHSCNPNKIHNLSQPFHCVTNKFTRACLNLLELSEFDDSNKFRHASIIVKNGRVIGSGVNTSKSHPMAIRPMIWKRNLLNSLWTLHAEMAAISSVKNKSSLRGSAIYIARKSQIGLRLSAPCAICEQYIRMYKINKIIYTTDDETWSEVRL